MTRSDIRQVLKAKHGAITTAAVAIGCSKQHLSNFLSGGDALSTGVLMRLVDHMRAEHGVEVDVEVLMRDVSGEAGPGPTEASA